VLYQLSRCLVVSSYVRLHLIRGYPSRCVYRFNPLKTKRICFIEGLSAYRAVNTLHFGYKNQSLDVL
jgi:hypothetical protein